MVKRVIGKQLGELLIERKVITPQQLEDKGSLGLLGMQERSLLIQGEFTIAPGPGGCGTVLTVRVPTAVQAAPEKIA